MSVNESKNAACGPPLEASELHELTGNPCYLKTLALIHLAASLSHLAMQLRQIADSIEGGTVAEAQAKHEAVLVLSEAAFPAFGQFCALSPAVTATPGVKDNTRLDTYLVGVSIDIARLANRGVFVDALRTLAADVTRQSTQHYRQSSDARAADDYQSRLRTPPEAENDEPDQHSELAADRNYLVDPDEV